MKYYDDKPINPKECVYINGFGFADNLHFSREKQLLKSYSSLAGISLMLVFLMNFFGGAFVFDMAYRMINSMFPMARGRFYIIFEYIMDNLLYFCSLFLPFFCYVKILGMPVSVALPFKKPDGRKFPSLVGMSLGCSVVAIYGSGLFIRFLDSVGIEFASPVSPMPSQTWEIILYAFQSVIIAPFVEEMVFRGMLMQSLRRFGDSFAIFVSAVIFSAIHANIYQFPIAFLMGIVLGFAVVVTGSIWTGIIIHMLHNGTMVALAVAENGVSVEMYDLIAYGIYALFLVIAIISILNLAKKCDYIFDLKNSSRLHTMGKKTEIYFSTLPMIFMCCLLLMMTVRYIRF